MKNYIFNRNMDGSGANMNSHVNMDKNEDHRNEIIIRIIQMEAL
jgi:hypothetical protein